MNSFHFILAVLLIHQGSGQLDQLHPDFNIILEECLAISPVTLTHLETLTKKDIPDSEAAKCLLACAYKKTGMMDAEGKLSAAGVKESTQKYFPENIKKSEEFAAACIKVNNEPVSDGSKGCDRAALIFRCIIERSPELQLT